MDNVNNLIPLMKSVQIAKNQQRPKRRRRKTKEQVENSEMLNSVENGTNAVPLRKKKPRHRDRNKKKPLKPEVVIDQIEEHSSIVLSFDGSICPAERPVGILIASSNKKQDKTIEKIYEFAKTNYCYECVTKLELIPQLKLAQGTTTTKTKNDKGVKVKKESEEPMKNKSFSEYVSFEEASLGVAAGTYLKGVVRINPKYFEEAYISDEDKLMPDICIESLLDRNGALEGDVVALEIRPKSEWRGEQKTAKVVYILEKVHSRKCVGTLNYCKKKKNQTYLVFSPRDHRLPRLKIHEFKNYMKNPKILSTHLFLAEIKEWTDSSFAIGIIKEDLGEANDLKAETTGILAEHSIEFGQFSKEAVNSIPKLNPDDFVGRLDFTKECVFTIDPLTAKDLDDALSIKKLPNGHYEVGVHIADVTHFLKEGTALDVQVSKRATSTYLVDKCYHMLPLELTLQCSLLPGSDSLCFSVIWEMDENAEIIETKFAKSVISNCVQLAYEHAQLIIDNPQQKFTATQFPPIKNGFTIEDIRQRVLMLYTLASKMRQRRFHNGSLRVNQIKLGFNLNQNGDPVSFYQQEQREANWTIEEFMLCANISVAQQIYKRFPDIAFLRCHEEPKLRLLNELKTTMDTLGIHLNVDDSGGLQSSLHKYSNGTSMSVALNHMLAKVMTRATYFCANNQPESQFRHYALSVPIYTHFTSPIRRYADVMVHRLLSASLDLTPAPKWAMEMVATIANNCNDKKYSAKCAGEKSVELYLSKYIKQKEPFRTDAVVIYVSQNYFVAISLLTGSVVRIYKNNTEENNTWDVQTYGPEEKMYRILIKSKNTSTKITIDLFQEVTIDLRTHSKSTNSALEASLVLD